MYFAFSGQFWAPSSLPMPSFVHASRSSRHPVKPLTFAFPPTPPRTSTNDPTPRNPLRYNIEEDVVSVKPTRPPPSAKAAAAAAAAAASAASAGASNGGYGGYSAATTSGAAGYGGYGAPAPAAAAAAAAAGGYGGGNYGQPATNGSSAAAAGMPAMPAMAAPPLPPKPKPSEPQARVLYDYDPAGQEGMVAVSAGQASLFLVLFCTYRGVFLAVVVGGGYFVCSQRVFSAAGACVSCLCVPCVYW